MFDFVCNHMSAKSEWFKNYLQQQPGFEDFFIAVDPQTDLSAVTRPRALPLLTPFQMDDNSTRHLWTTFSDDQIDLNYRSPDVLLAMVDVLLCYLEKGAEYVRLDAVGFMWKEPGTSCIHLEKTHLIIKLLRSIIDDIAPGTVIITETNVPHKDNIAYFGEGDDEAHMVYQFSLPPLVLHAVQKQNVEALCQWAQSLSLPSGKTTWFNFLASHDGIGLNPLRGLLPESEILALVEALQQEGALVNWKNNPDGTRSPYEINVTYMDALSRRESSDEERCARFILAHAILLSFPGVPAIYIQSILGSRNDYAGVEKLGYNRAINRKKYHSEEITRELNDEFGTIEFHNGGILWLETSFALNIREQSIMNVSFCGDKAGATLFPAHIYTDNNGELMTLMQREMADDNRHLGSMEAFINHVQGKPVMIADAEQGYIIQQLVAALYQSAETGTRVEL